MFKPLLFLALVFAPSLLSAQDDPDYLTGNVPVYFYDCAAKQDNYARHITAVFQNQSGAGIFNGQAGMIGGTWSGKKEYFIGGLLHSFDAITYKRYQQTKLFGSIRLCHIGASELRFGFEFATVCMNIDEQRLVQVLNKPIDSTHSDRLKKATFDLNPGLSWNWANGNLGAGIVHTTGQEMIWGFESRPLYSILPRVVLRRIYYVHGTIRHNLGNGQIRLNALARYTNNQAIWYARFDNSSGNTYKWFVDSIYNSSRNVNGKFLLTLNAAYSFGRYTAGLIVRGFGAHTTAGLQFGYDWHEGGKLWIAALAPRKTVGWSLESGVSLGFKRHEKPHPSAHPDDIF